MTTGGQLLVQCLLAQGTDRVFCVPGESYLPILDALYDTEIDTIVARQEGGAAMMAEADGKATGRPGICLVTRGPGAANAMAGIHVAQQDSTPMIVIIGQVARAVRGRDAFQEVNFEATFSTVAKLVIEIDDPDQIPDSMTAAFHTAMNGRPGPVIISVPQDILSQETSRSACSLSQAIATIPSDDSLAMFNTLVDEALQPVVIIGGSRWNAEAITKLQHWASDKKIPVTTSFRRQHLFPATHVCYAGELGIGANPALIKLISDSDLIILLGGRLSEIPSQNYTLLDIPVPKQKLVHIHPDPSELGHVYQPTLGIAASPIAFLQAIDIEPERSVDPLPAHANYISWSEECPAQPGDIQLRKMVQFVNHTLGDQAIICNGAGNYAAWVHRFFRYPAFRSQFAPNSGSMGYGLPAAIAAKLRFPNSPVVCFAGDGCLQMTIQELGTASQFDVHIIVLVIDNGMYGTIRMHQEKHFPDRVSATSLQNPDFKAVAEAYGYFSETVTTNEAFESLFLEALAAKKPALLHLKTDPEGVTPTLTIAQLREG
ncbi:MAG: thiamine pyrophosphate-binding protein [Pseudomonadales bacterium]|nr:thiamine pyrophosphate-binding protein [Pseudomonadales bacterium]